VADVLTKSRSIENALEKIELHFGNLILRNLEFVYVNEIDMY